jgi:hypothetical protein
LHLHRLPRLVAGETAGDGLKRLPDRIEMVQSFCAMVLRCSSPNFLPRTMMRPLVKPTSSRICSISSHPARRRAGVMNLVQMSRSLRVRLSMLLLRIGRFPIRAPNIATTPDTVRGGVTRKYHPDASERPRSLALLARRLAHPDGLKRLPDRIEMVQSFSQTEIG